VLSKRILIRGNVRPPSPEGRGWHAPAGREGYSYFFTPHPVLRTTLSLQERELSVRCDGRYGIVRARRHGAGLHEMSYDAHEYLDPPARSP
jgi:hypothetical protein